jgi:hypothetical protein
MKKNNYIIKIGLANGNEVHSRVEEAKNQEEALKTQIRITICQTSSY